MRRTRALLAVLGLLAAGGTLGVLELVAPSTAPTAAEPRFTGRYRDGRGRFGREGPPLVQGGTGGGGGGCTASVCSGLSAYYAFEDANDSVRGDAGTLTFTGTSVASGGKLGDALSITSGSQTTRFPAVNLGKSFTIACWVNNTPPQFAPGGYGAILVEDDSQGTSGRGLSIRQASGYKFMSWNGTTEFISSAAVDGTWQFVLVTYETGVAVEIHVNDALVYISSGNVWPGTGFTPTEFGNFNVNNQFIGRIDECLLANRVYDAAERTYLFNSGAARTYPFQ